MQLCLHQPKQELLKTIAIYKVYSYKFTQATVYQHGSIKDTDAQYKAIDTKAFLPCLQWYLTDKLSITGLNPVLATSGCIA